MVKLTRRTLLSAAAASGVAAAASPASRSPAAPALRPISMATHIHGPFSEGAASYEAHLQQARQHGVDVIWWTDHDFRVAAHDFREAVHFTGTPELEGELAWNWAQSVEGTLTSSTAQFSSGALRLAAAGNGALWYAGTAWNTTYSSCIADTTLELDVRPERMAADAVLVVHIELSYHPARGGRPAGNYILRYRIGGVSAPRVSTADLVGTVDVPVTPGTWNRLVVNPVDDVARLFPDLVAADNSLRNLRLGVQVEAGASGSFLVDRLVFHRGRRTGQAGEQLRAEVLGRYAEEYPDVIGHRAYEISLVRHLNWYGGDQTLPAFPSPPYRDNDPKLTASMVDFLHAHGGVVCWNHPLDVEKRESLGKLMIERNRLGVDLVEIGREPLADLLWVYDVAARNGLFCTAIGGSDDHDAFDWLAVEEPYLTCVWAPSTSRSELVQALRRGRAWIVDMARYRGQLDLRRGGRTAMGGVLVTTSAKVGVDIVATDLPADATLEVITGVADFAGTAKLAPATSTRSVPAKLVKNGTYRVTVTVGNGSYLRTQVRDANGRIVGLSNPLWLLSKKPPRPIPPDRKL